MKNPEAMIDNLSPADVHELCASMVRILGQPVRIGESLPNYYRRVYLELRTKIDGADSPSAIRLRHDRVDFEARR